MKIYRLPQLAEAHEDGTYLLGLEDLKSNAVYMAYARLRPGEAPRKLAPPEGREEIVFVIKGSLLVRSGKTSVPVGPGEAFHVKGSDNTSLENSGSEDAVFIAAGGSAVKAEEAVKEKAIEEPPVNQAFEAAPEEGEPEFIITREGSSE
ncbi:MAG: hypothetical protein H3C68_04485 [Deltaproteobacteria bacterium]|nr:hypothetical protein [Deltaproteobacteria bacterium]MBZ0219983.1 hypothetical protein [Deltaproteobacteria bacterium]